MTVPDRGSLSRREYTKTLVAMGGASALAACLGERDERTIPAGTDDPTTLPDRQHAWNDVLDADEDGNTLLSNHHVLLALSLRSDGEPSRDERETVADALATLERAYEWSNDGLLFTIGYAPAYFDRFDASPEGADLPAPEALTPSESPELDTADALLHLASDHHDVVLEAEEGLFGEHDNLNGVAVGTALDEVFERGTRRTGFVGAGMPAERTDTPGVPDAIHEEAPFFMGFRSGFARSQATEDRVTIGDGPFAGSTTEHVESLRIQLDVWYEQDNHFQRVAKLFSPEHAREELVGEYGERLDDSNALTDERIDSTADDARQHGVVGHAQKAARAREDGDPPLLRRDVNTTNGDEPGLHFLSLQREIDDFVRAREAMTGADLAGNGVGRSLNNGILQYITVERRGNFLVPPRSLRALPPARPDGDG